MGLLKKDRDDAYPILALPYGTVLFPGRTLHISPANRPDVIAIIANYYSGALRTKSKDNAPLINCVPLRSPYLSPDGRKLIEGGAKEESNHEEPDSLNLSRKDLFNYGTLAKIVGIRGGKSGELAIVVDGINRCKLDKMIQETPYFEATVKVFKDEGTYTHHFGSRKALTSKQLMSGIPQSRRLSPT